MLYILTPFNQYKRGVLLNPYSNKATKAQEGKVTRQLRQHTRIQAQVFLMAKAMFPAFTLLPRKIHKVKKKSSRKKKK